MMLWIKIGGEGTESTGDAGTGGNKNT